MKQSLKSTLKQTSSFSLRQQDAVRTLQLTSTALAQEIQQELNINPFLELADTHESLTDPLQALPDGEDNLSPEHFKKDEGLVQTDSLTENTQSTEMALDIPAYAQNINVAPSYNQPSRNTSNNSRRYIESLSASNLSLQAHLHKQAGKTPLNEKQHALLALLIDSVEDNGYLGTSLQELRDYFGDQLPITLAELENCLAVLQQFEPTGVGCRDLSECLSLQLTAMEGNTTEQQLALELVHHHLPLLGAKKMAALRKKLSVSQTTLDKIISLIQSLDPNPGACFESTMTIYISADIFVERIDDRWQAYLNKGNTPQLALSPYTEAWMKAAKTSAEQKPLQEHLERAKRLLSQLEGRHQTLLAIAGQIIEQQQDYFNDGDIAMKPLSLKHISDALGIHVSTVSRAVNGKYLLYKGRLIELKTFFSASLAQQSGDTSATSVKSIIKQLIAEEPPNRPISDNALTEQLAKSGIKIARRTVAKYREQLKIPASSMRKHL